VDNREAANRAAVEHIERLRARLAAGKSEIDRQRAAVDETREHLSGISRWIRETDRLLGDERARREAGGGRPAGP
jgi:chromosome segregation ATPase